MGTPSRIRRASVGHHPPDDYLSQVGAWDANEGQRVVLLDLDGTLMSSTKAREDAWRRSLVKLDEVIRADLKTRLDAYKAIYDCHELITGRPGRRGHVFEDFRQEWNTRSSYALLIAWFQTLGHLPEGFDYKAELKGLLNSEKGPDLLTAAEAIREPWSIEYTVPIERAMAAFWDGDWTQYLERGVRVLLRSLDRAGIRYYIATEGHVPTQWRKICKVQLDQVDPISGKRLVTQEQLLATSQAAQPRREIDAMDSLVKWYRGRAAASEQAAERLERQAGAQQYLDALRDDSRVANLVADGLARIADLFKRLAEKLHDQGGTKSAFYIRTIYAIHQDLDRPRSKFKSFDLSWDPGNTPIRLAMVGDNYQSDIKPVVALADQLYPGHAKIMSVWLRRQGHGDKPAPADESARWLEADTIDDAGKKHILHADKWRTHTEPMEKPTRLFGSAVDPDPRRDESLNLILDQLIAGIAVVWGDKHSKQDTIPDTDVARALKGFMDAAWFKVIVADIRSGDSHEEVQNSLLVQCADPFLREYKPLFLCPGSQYAAVKLLLAVSADGSSAIGKAPQRSDLFRLFASLLKVEDKRWAASVIDVLEERPEVDEWIAQDGLLIQYLQGLRELRASKDLPGWFPVDGLLHVFERLRGLQPREHQEPRATPEVGESPSPVQEVIDMLGYAARDPGLQQSVRLGKSNSGREVWCDVGGPEAGNIICVCGEEGIGKFSTLATLVRGALRGEGAKNSKAPRSSVVVFNKDPSAVKRLVELAASSGSPVEVVVLDSELASMTERLKGTRAEVRLLQFRLNQLSEAVLLELIGYKDKQVPPELSRIIRRAINHRMNLDELINEVERAKFRGKSAVQAALEDLRPFLSDTNDVVDELNDGKLTILDCGRTSGAPKAEVTRTWARFLAILAEQREGVGHTHYLLVFDELAQTFGERLTQDEKHLDEVLERLAGVRRHLQVSMLGISQTPKELLRVGTFSRHATVLLFHKLRQSPPVASDLPLWQLARNASSTFETLGKGEVWYASTSSGATTGRVQIDRP